MVALHEGNRYLRLVESPKAETPLWRTYAIAVRDIAGMFTNPARRPRSYISEWADPEQMPLLPFYSLQFPGFEHGHRQELLDAIHMMQKNWGAADKENVPGGAWRLYRNGRGDLMGIIYEKTGSVETPYANTVENTLFPIQTVVAAIEPHLVRL